VIALRLAKSAAAIAETILAPASILQFLTVNPSIMRIFAKVPV